MELSYGWIYCRPTIAAMVCVQFWYECRLCSSDGLQLISTYWKLIKCDTIHQFCCSAICLSEIWIRQAMNIVLYEKYIEPEMNIHIQIKGKCRNKNGTHRVYRVWGKCPVHAYSIVVTECVCMVIILDHDKTWQL